MDEININCVYERTLYSDGNSGYTVLVMSTNEEIPESAIVKSGWYPSKRRYPFTVVYTDLTGMLAGLTKDTQYAVTGKWTTSKYGVQLSADIITPVYGSDKEDIMRFLMSIKGVGKRTAEKIYRAFGADTIRIIRDEPEKMKTVRGLKPKIIAGIIDGYKEQCVYIDLQKYLGKFSISARHVKQIYERFHDRAIDIVSSDPFAICVCGIEFPVANSIAVDSGIGLSSYARIKACFLYVLEVWSRRGHLFMEINDLYKNTYNLLLKDLNGLEITNKMLNDCYNELIVEGSIVDCRFDNKIVVYKKSYYVCECEVAKKIIDFNHNPHIITVKEDILSNAISEMEQETGITLGGKQKQAVITALNSGLSVITGGPGTGKSTSLKFITALYEKLYGQNVVLCAPTGRAARRMAECSGENGASTIHSLLGITEDYVWSEVLNNTLTISDSLVVVDECSMIDMELMYLLLANIDFSCKVVFLGDSDQLPSVGPGNVLREIVRSCMVPVVTLDVIYRQQGMSSIVINADRIKNGDTNYLYKDDFVFYEASGKIVEDQIVSLYMNELQKPGMNIDNVQILTPYKKAGAPCSTIVLNDRIRDLVNPPSVTKKELKISKFLTIREGDKVIQQRNVGEIKNGDIGYVKAIGNSSSGLAVMLIEFSEHRLVEYGKEEAESYGLHLAYACTVHKSQGSEYSTVIMPIIAEHRALLRKNLIYTAWTRAKKNVYMVGSQKVLKEMSLVNDIDSRNTALAQRLYNRELQYQMRKKTTKK